jgi:hypothetical protein
LAPASIASAAVGFTLQVERLYAALTSAAVTDSGPDPEPSLGGKLLYAGELDGEARALLVAANIVGAASLVSTADAAAQKLAIRDGVADFLVSSLDEALRILKNEVRKRQTVAVCVALAPEAAAREMLERGVLPDMLRPAAGGLSDSAPFLSQGARQIELAAPEEGQTLLTWRVASSPAVWLPKLDAIARDCLSRDSSLAAGVARRWLRLAPRYLGRLAQDARLLRCDDNVAAKFIEEVSKRVECGEIEVSVELEIGRAGKLERYSFTPRTS